MKTFFNDPRYRPAVIALSSFILLICFLVLTNPKKSPLIVLLIPFVLLFMVLYNALIYILPILMPHSFTRRHGKAVAIIIGFEPVLLLLLASINQLTWRDGILSFILICGFAWYLSRATFTS
jgi:hypothetical protein